MSLILVKLLVCTFVKLFYRYAGFLVLGILTNTGLFEELFSIYFSSVLDRCYLKNINQIKYQQ